MEQMAELRHKLGDIQEALETLHENSNNSEVGMSIFYRGTAVYCIVHSDCSTYDSAIGETRSQTGPSPR